MGITDYDGEGINAGTEFVHKVFGFSHPTAVYRMYEP